MLWKIDPAEIKNTILINDILDILRTKLNKFFRMIQSATLYYYLFFHICK